MAGLLGGPSVSPSPRAVAPRLLAEQEALSEGPSATAESCSILDGRGDGRSRHCSYVRTAYTVTRVTSRDANATIVCRSMVRPLDVTVNLRSTYLRLLLPVSHVSL